MGGGGSKPIDLEKENGIDVKHDGKFYVFLDITCEDFPIVHVSGDGYHRKDKTKRHVGRAEYFLRPPTKGLHHDALYCPPAALTQLYAFCLFLISLSFSLSLSLSLSFSFSFFRVVLAGL